MMGYRFIQFGSTALLLAASLAQAADSSMRLQEELLALARLPEAPERLGARSRLLHFLAEGTADERKREQLHREGLKFAERAMAINPKEPSALLWWCAHRGSQVSASRPWEAVQIAKEVESALLRLREVDPLYEHSAADRVLGHLYRIAPPLFSIGSISKAEMHLRAALERAPEFPGNQLYYAQFLLQRRDCPAAQEYARQVLKSPELSMYPLEARSWINDAQKVLVSVDRRCRERSGRTNP